MAEPLPKPKRRRLRPPVEAPQAPTPEAKAPKAKPSKADG